MCFARIKQATDPLPPDGWCFLVLTLDRDGYYSGQPWSDVNAAYRALGKMTRAALQRIGAEWGPESKIIGKKRPRTVRKLGNRWVAVVEAHRSGWPHVNLLVWCPELAEYLRRARDARLQDSEVANAVALARDAWKNGEPLQPRDRELARRATVIGGELGELLEDAGWGRESTAEAARSADAIAGYVVKLAGNHDAAAGELAKITQAPMNAPERFRRLRSGKSFLPPRYSNPEVTGCLVRRRAPGEQWKGQIHAMNPPKDLTQTAAVCRAARAELALMAEERSIALRSRGKPVPMPPMRLALRGELESHTATSERRAALRARTFAACG